MMQRVAYLDGLKGFGCLMVFICHFIMVGFAYPAEWYNNIVSSTLFNGNIFVCVFLIASAFGMTGSVKRNLLKDNGLRNLILKRYLRLAIPIGIILMLIGIVHVLNIKFNREAALLNGNERLVQELGSWVSIKDFPKALFLTTFGKSYNWMSQAWMMGYIYFGTFLVVILEMGVSSLSSPKRLFICLFLMIVFYFIDFYYINIIIGYLYYNYMGGAIAKNKCSFTYRLLPILLFILFCAFIYCKECKNLQILENDNIIIASLLVFMLFHSSVLKSIFSLKLFVWLGKISFSLYLLHMMVLVTFSSWMYVLTDGLNETLQSVITLSTSVVFLLMLSAMSKQYIEDKISNTIIQRIMGVILNETKQS